MYKYAAGVVQHSSKLRKPGAAAGRCIIHARRCASVSVGVRSCSDGCALALLLSAAAAVNVRHVCVFRALFVGAAYSAT